MNSVSRKPSSEDLSPFGGFQKQKIGLSHPPDSWETTVDCKYTIRCSSSHEGVTNRGRGFREFDVLVRSVEARLPLAGPEPAGGAGGGARAR